VARTLVDGKTIEKPPKTKAGKRTLPLDGALISALKAFKAAQAGEKLAAGEAYDSTGDYVVCDELGAPSDPARLRRAWYRLMREAKIPKIKPYTASRHAAASYLANQARFAGDHRRLAWPHGRRIHHADLRARPARGPRRGTRRTGSEESR
jgi:hypothetical protein